MSRRTGSRVVPVVELRMPKVEETGVKGISMNGCPRRASAGLCSLHGSASPLEPCDPAALRCPNPEVPGNGK